MQVSTKFTASFLGHKYSPPQKQRFASWRQFM